MYESSNRNFYITLTIILNNSCSLVYWGELYGKQRKRITYFTI